MGVDASASSLAPNPVKVEHQKPVSTEHHKLTLSERIKNIFNKPTQPDNSPHDTLVELANLDSPEDQTDIKSPENIPEPSQSKEETIIIDPQSETPSVDTTALEKEDQQETAEEIKQVTQTIQQESAPKVEVVETPKTLFPDSPPLYDQYHRAYEREKKTIKGALARSQDISVLRGRGKDRRDNRDEISDLYDTLRSHGLSREQILAKNSDGKLLLWQDVQESTKHYINSHPDKYSYHPTDTAPFSFTVRRFSFGIDRLDSLGRFDPNFLDSPEKFNQTVRDAVAISDDHDFEKNKNQFNQYIFLSRQDLIPLFVEGKYYGSSSDRFNALSSLQKKFFSTPENETKFNSYLDEHPEINKDIFSFICNRGRNGGRKNIIPFNQVLVDSDINPEEKIILPQECIYESGWYSDELQAFYNLDTREQQRFLSKQINLNTDPNKDLIGHYFNRDKKPNSNFYKDFIVDSYNLEKVVTLPDGQIIDSTTDLSTEDFYKFLSISSSSSEYKPFFDSVLNLKDLDPNIFCSIFLDKSRIAQYFDQNNQPTSTLFKDIAHEFGRTPWWQDSDKVKLSAEAFQKFFTSNLTSEDIQTFPSVEDQKFWNNVISLKDISIYNFQRLLGDNSYLNSEGKPTPQFLENFCKNGDSESISKFFTSNLTSEDIQTFPSVEDQKFWSRFINLKNQYSGIYQFMDKNQSMSDSFFTPDNLPTSLFFQEYIKYDPTSSSSSDPSKINWLTSNLTQDVFANFSPEDKKNWQNLLQLKNLNDDSLKAILKGVDDINLLFDKSGNPTAYLFENLFKNKLTSNFDFFKANLTPEIIKTFSSIEDQKKWTVVSNLTNSVYSENTKYYVFWNIESIYQKIILYPNPKEALNQYLSVIEQINLSPSKEIQKIKSQLLTEILNTVNPLEAYQKISDIFVKNNLPMVGKIYRVFNVLYPPEKINQMLSKKDKLSRVLIDTKSSRLRQQIIFNDLLKVNFGSGEQSLANYLNLFETSSPLLEKVRSGKDLTSTESAQLSSFFKKLDTLYDASLLSRIQTTETLDTSTLQSRISEIYQKYKVAEGQTISDRVAQMYLSGLGIKSIPEALNYIKQTRESAHQRNLARTDFSLPPGDLIKRVNSQNLDNIFNFGCVAREYLGSDADSDDTPLDTDTIMIKKLTSANEISSIGDSIYGDLTIVIKDRGQFQNTTDSKNNNYNSTKLEVFYSGVVSGQHYGIRTGFPSSEIDFLVTTDTSPQMLENMYYEIAKHGVYIPVLDKDGNQIFTPDDYSRYRHSFDGVKQFSDNSFQVETLPADDPFRSEIDNLKKTLEIESTDTVAQADVQVREKIKSILDSLNISLKDQYDTSLLGARLHNIGSSGRHTNLPGDFDFDYTLVLDVPSYQKSEEVTSEIVRQFSHQSQIPAAPSQIRLTGVTGVAPKPIDLDIGINTTADTLIFASHEAIEQKLEFIRQTYGQDTYHEVVANILLAKQILKENHAYKKGDAQDGGFGGIGTENWILANNGNIKKAFESFWQAAHEDGREVSLDEFRKKYFILDSGQNLRETDRTHDNFIFALTDKGYHAMLTAIGKHI